MVVLGVRIITLVVDVPFVDYGGGIIIPYLTRVNRRRQARRPMIQRGGDRPRTTFVLDNLPALCIPILFFLLLLLTRRSLRRLTIIRA